MICTGYQSSVKHSMHQEHFSVYITFSMKIIFNSTDIRYANLCLIKDKVPEVEILHPITWQARNTGTDVAPIASCKDTTPNDTMVTSPIQRHTKFCTTDNAAYSTRSVNPASRLFAKATGTQ